MKKILFILVVIIITSCNSVKYVHKGNANSRLDFKEGKWLLNHVTSSKNVKEYGLTKIASEKFSELFGDRLLLVNTKKGILIPGVISENLDKSILKDIKNGSGCDYFIDVRTKKTSDEVDVFGAGNDLMSSNENVGEVNLTIYDLNLLEEIYSQSVVGTLFIPENQNNFALSKTSGSIIASGLKKIMKKIRKNQIK